MVDVVGEYVERHVGGGFHDVTVRQASSAGGLERPIADFTALLCVKNRKIPVSRKITKSPRIATDLIPRTVKRRKKNTNINKL